MVINGKTRTSNPLASRLYDVRQRTEAIFNLIHPDAYYVSPIPLRHPFVFYEGHIPAFNWNTFFIKTLGQAPYHPEFEALFARGIDPADEASATHYNPKQWPRREAVLQYKNHVQNQFDQYLNTTDFSTDSEHALKYGPLFSLLIEHELMHQETLMYLIHQLPPHLKHQPAEIATPRSTANFNLQPIQQEIPAGMALLGASTDEFEFVWDNESPQIECRVSGFTMDVYNVTNGQFQMFVAEEGYARREFWEAASWKWLNEKQIKHPFFWKKIEDRWFLRDLFTDIPLPRNGPVYVTHAEARAYARFTGQSLPTEAEWHRAAFGDNQHWHYPWGNTEPTSAHGNFHFQQYSPVDVGSYPEGASSEGVLDLVGNGWEWTDTRFAPFPGFQPSQAYPQYSADFFDGQHYVLKGASNFTDKHLLRRSFRNWFYGHYPYAYATFRCVTRH